MTQKILGPEGSKRRKRFWLVPMLAALFAVVFSVAGATGEPGGPPNSPTIFELDASLDPASTSPPNAAVTDNAGAGLPDDWDRVCHKATAGAQCPTAADDHAIARSFNTETTATGSADQQTIFTTGGSKDQGALSGWKWKDNAGGLPDKDNLLHAMAARYNGNATPPSSYIFFASDRFDNSGDAQVGFWFFRTTVCTKADGTFGNVLTAGVCSGTAVHSAGVVPHSAANAGDILILSDFTNGGTQPTIRIFEWVGSGGSDGELNLLNPTVGGVPEVRDCGTVLTDDFCGAVNNFDGSTAPWLFLNKSGQNTFGHGEFYEGGLNLNRFGLQNECFSTFLAETRSSQSVTATLKDFVLGSFQQCSATLSTAPTSPVGSGGTVTPGTIVTDTATVTGIGGQNPPNPTGSVSFYICGPIATGVCSSTTTQVGVAKPLSASNPATAVSDGFDTTGKTPGRYCFYATWPGDTNYPGQLTHSGTGDSECFTVAKIPTGTVTTPVDGSGASKTAINLGESIFDKAVVTGNSVGGDPTGTVKFFVCGPVAAPATCDTGGTQVGTPVEGETLVSDGVAGTFTSSVTSEAVTPTAVGRYCFRAEYGGSTVYIGSSDSSSTECFTVGKLPTTTVTTPVNASGVGITGINLGQSIFDKAVVTGSAGGGDPTGTVKFFVCGPIASPATCSTGGTQVGTPVEGETLVSDGVAGTFTSSVTSEAVTPTAVGRYCFRAEYGGDDDYTGSSDSATTECFTVTDTTGATSAQTWRPNDSATITSAGGAPLNGTLSFTLYQGLTCSGTILRAAQSFTLTNAVSPATRTTTNTTVDVDVTKDVSWGVVFTSNDPNVGSSSHCEKTSLTITN